MSADNRNIIRHDARELSDAGIYSSTSSLSSLKLLVCCSAMTMTSYRRCMKMLAVAAGCVANTFSLEETE
jgi:hypothetical protein